MSRAFYITTPIYYVNDRPHIGHAYTTIACDVLARFKRLDGYQVKFLTGTDEHGQKVSKAAADKGVTPQALCDENSQNFRNLAKTLGVSNDDFIRTTEPRHVRACQALWEKLKAKGQVRLSKYKGSYAVRDEAFYTRSEVVFRYETSEAALTAIKAVDFANTSTISDVPGGQFRGDILTSEGPFHLLISGDASAGTAPIFAGSVATGAPVSLVEEESYFFPLSEWQERLLAFYDANPDFIGPKSRFNEVYSFVKGGLQDLSISRTAFTWGIPVPGDPKHVMYVWIDALTNYITALGYPDNTADFETFWSGPDSFAMHMVGKDIIRFHCVYWPAFLMAAGVPVPKKVFAHGWWTVEGQKMSKSLGNAIDPNDMVAKYGLDQIRYFLMREVPFGNDGDFSEAAIAGRINGELANALGNLAQRFLSFIAKNLGGVLPAPGERSTTDNGLLQIADGMLKGCRFAMERQAIHEALEHIWEAVRAGNAYVDSQAPWTLRKTDPARMNTVLWVLAETVRHIAILMQPFVPTSAAKMLDQLAVAPDARTFAHLTPAHALKGGTALPTPEGVFPRYGDPKIAGKGA